jgi:hypothetical protein
MKKIFYLVAAAAFLCSCAEEAPNENGDEATGSIYGIIADKATSEPVRSAGVQLNPTGTKTITGSEGQYEFTELKAGDYTINVTKTGYTDLVNYKITVAAGKTNKGDVQLEKLPPSLRVVNDKQQDIDTLDFGSATGDVARSFSIFNDGPESLEWQLTETSEWITGVSKAEGTLKAGAAQAIVLTIDREKLSNGNNSTTVHITSDNGSKQLIITATKPLPILNTLAATNITATSAKFNGVIIDNGHPSYTERGFVYSTSSMPTLENTIAKLTATITNNKEYSANVSELTLSQTYYVRAYAINSVGTAYSSNEVSFIPSYPNIVKVGNLLVPKTNVSNGCDWGDALSICNSYEVDGVTGWRTPTRTEMLSIRSSEELTFSGSYWVNESPQEVQGSWCGGNIYNYSYDVKLFYVNMTNGTSSYYTYHVGCTTGSATIAAAQGSTTKYYVRCVK